MRFKAKNQLADINMKKILVLGCFFITGVFMVAVLSGCDFRSTKSMGKP